MPRRRTPTRILEMTGALAHDRKRYANRTAEPVPAGELGEAPEPFDKNLKLIWNEMVAQVPEGVLTNADRVILELAVRLTAKMRKGELTAAVAAQLVSCLSRLAMTPSDRSKVQVTPDKANPAIPPSPFAQFVQ
jgi:hypothetical protein